MSAKTSGRSVEKSTHLSTQVALAEEGLINPNTGRLWPTPRTRDAQPEGLAAGIARAEKYSTMSLPTAVKLWPMPTARDWKGGRKPETLAQSGRGFSNSLNDALTVTGELGALNPTWVEALMGFPHSWTDMSGRD